MSQQWADTIYELFPSVSEREFETLKKFFKELDRTDNRIENLVITTRSEHLNLHRHSHKKHVWTESERKRASYLGKIGRALQLKLKGEANAS